jgi:hypothetical protein
VFCANLLIVFEKLVPNDGIHTLESNHVHLVNQASYVHFFCNQVQSNDDDKVECILSFDLYDERVRRNLLPPDLLGDPIFVFRKQTTYFKLIFFILNISNWFLSFKKLNEFIEYYYNKKD